MKDDGSLVLGRIGREGWRSALREHYLCDERRCYVWLDLRGRDSPKLFDVVVEWPPCRDRVAHVIEKIRLDAITVNVERSRFEPATFRSSF